MVFLKTWATEGYDRLSLLVDWDGDALVKSVAAECPNTVVVTNGGGVSVLSLHPPTFSLSPLTTSAPSQLNVLPFADNPNVTAIVANHFPGEQVGNSIVDILWGDVNPSGKLPYTIAYEQDDYTFAPITNSTALLNTNDPNAWQSDFEERLLVDYRKSHHVLVPYQSSAP